MAKKIEVTEWSEFDFLDNEETIIDYLHAVANDKDPNELLLAIGTVAHARGINKMAEELGIDRKLLYKNLSGEIKPEFGTVCKVIDKLGLEMYFKVKEG